MEETGGCLLRGCGLTVANAEAERPPQYYDYGVDHLGAPAVSEETAVEIAAPARGMVSATNVVVSTTGIARPSGGTLDRGVGTVSAWVGLGNQDRGAALPAVEIQGLVKLRAITSGAGASVGIFRGYRSASRRPSGPGRALLTFRPFRASTGKEGGLLMNGSKLKAALGALALSTSLAAAPVWAAETTTHHHHTHHHYHHHHKHHCPKKSHKKHHHKKHTHKAKKAA